MERSSRGVSVSASSSSNSNSSSSNSNSNSSSSSSSTTTTSIYPKSQDAAASFSSYLTPNAHSDYDPSSISTPNADQEISIFDAQKYFNELSITNVNDPRKVSGNQCRFSWTAASSFSAEDDNFIDSRSTSTIGRIHNCARARSFHVVSATPTASSEASWNSQTGLLSNPYHSGAATTNNIAFMTSLRTLSSDHSHLHAHSPHDQDHGNRNKKLSPSARWFSFPMRRRSARCPCSGKKSVQVVAQETTKSKINYGNEAQSLPDNKVTTTASSIVVSTAANLNTTSSSSSPPLMAVAAAGREENHHYIWGTPERRSNWDRHQITSTILPPPNCSSTTSTSNAPAFTFPVLKLNNGAVVGGTSSLLPKGTSGMVTVVKNDHGTTLDSLQVFGGGCLSDHHHRQQQQYSSTIIGSTMSHKPHSSSNATRVSAHHRQLPCASAANFTFPATSESRIISAANDVIDEDDDVGSDASSDLFEIESFSTSTAAPTTTTTTQTIQTSSGANIPTYALYQNYYRTRSRDSSLDDPINRSGGGQRLSANNIFPMRSLDDRRPNEPIRTSLSDQQYCYEPSEASIDWSVTTAEAFDRPDQYDQYDQSDQYDHHHHNNHVHQEDNDQLSNKRRASSSSLGNNNMGLLLSCRREKAVSVGPNPVRLSPPPPHMAAKHRNHSNHSNHSQRHTAVGVGPTHVSVSLNSRVRHVGK